MDVDKAVIKLQATLKWRQENSIDTFIEDFEKSPFYEALKKYWPSAYLGDDSIPEVLFFERMGHVDIKSMLSAIPPDTLVKYHIYANEKHERRRRELEEIHNKAVPLNLMVDASGASMRLAHIPALNVMKKLSFVDDEYYPGLVNKQYLINAPSVFSTLWKMLKPFLSKSTLDSISVIDQSVVLDIYPKPVLPTFIGGELQLEIAPGGIFDPAVYIPTQKQVKVSRSSTHEHIVEARKGLLFYYFSTEKNDIGFQILYKQSKESKDGTVLLENRRYDCHIETISSSISVENPGYYVFQWDNTFSTFKSKLLLYNVTHAELDSPLAGTSDDSA